MWVAGGRADASLGRPILASCRSGARECVVPRVSVFLRNLHGEVREFRPLSLLLTRLGIGVEQFVAKGATFGSDLTLLSK